MRPHYKIMWRSNDLLYECRSGPAAEQFRRDRNVCYMFCDCREPLSAMLDEPGFEAGRDEASCALWDTRQDVHDFDASPVARGEGDGVFEGGMIGELRVNVDEDAAQNNHHFMQKHLTCQAPMLCFVDIADAR